MKKFIFLTLCLLSQMVSLQALEFDVEARVAYFYPSDNRMREVYNQNGWANYQIEASTPFDFCCDCSCDWRLWTNVSYFHETGHSSCLRDKTSVNNWAVNFGLKRYFETCMCLRPYLGLGVGFAYVQFNDHSPFVHEHVRRWGVAVLAKSGIQYDVTCNLFLDLFLDYAYNGFRFHGCCGSRRHVDTGGLNVGLGLGYKF